MKLRLLFIFLCISVYGYTQNTTVETMRIKGRMILTGDTLSSVLKTISNAATHYQTPTAKAVYNFVTAQNYLQTVQKTTRLSGLGTAAFPLDLAQQGAVSGQVLKWNGTEWAPANDAGGTVISADSLMRAVGLYTATSGTLPTFTPNANYGPFWAKNTTDGVFYKWNRTGGTWSVDTDALTGDATKSNGSTAVTISTASASVRGLLSSADWNMFNGKVGGSGTVGYIPKLTGTSTLGNSNIFDSSGKIIVNGTSGDSILTISQPGNLGGGYYFPTMLTPTSATNAYYGIGWSPTGNGFNAVAGIAAARIGSTTGDLALFASSNRSTKMGASSIRMYLVGLTGHVGVGTTSPAYRLDVNGDINIASGQQYRANGIALWSASGTNIHTSTNTVIGGAVGDSMFTIYKPSLGTSFNLPMMVTGNGNTATAWQGIGWSPTGNGFNAVAAIVGTRPTSTTGALGFATSGNRSVKMTASDIRMLIDATGNVGIGTTTTAARLHVVGSGGTSATLGLQVHNITGTNNAFMVRDDGNVGVGTSAPASKIEMSSASNQAVNNTGGLMLSTPSDATVGLQQWSPPLVLRGRGWKTDATAGSRTVDVALLAIPEQGTDLPSGGLSVRANYGNFGWNTEIIRFLPGFTQFGNSLNLRTINSAGVISTSGERYEWRAGLTSTVGAFAWSFLNGNGARTAISGTNGFINFQESFSPTSGTGTYQFVRLRPVINQTGGASGETYGLIIDPLLTSAADYRSLQIVNSTGWAIHSSGTAPSYIAGDVRIGTTTAVATAALDVTSTTKGFLPPRMTAVQASDIASPAQGLQLFVTSTNATFPNIGWWGYNGTAWVRNFLSADPVLVGGNTNGANLLIGTNDNFDVQFETGGAEKMRLIHASGNLAIGATTAAARVHVVSGGSTSASWTAQFHNNTTSSNTLMLRDDARVGVGTTTLPAIFNIAAGTTSAAPLNIPAGTATSSLTAGNIENNGTNLTYSDAFVRYDLIKGFSGTSSALDFPNLSLGEYSVLTFSDSRAKSGDQILISNPNFNGGGFLFTGGCTVDGTIYIQAFYIGAGSSDMPSQTYKYSIIR